MDTDILLTLGVLGLNYWTWHKGKLTKWHRIILAAASVLFLYWLNYARKWGWNISNPQNTTH
jgi:membrane protein DedA with SNARE-associated domain